MKSNLFVISMSINLVRMKKTNNYLKENNINVFVLNNEENNLENGVKIIKRNKVKFQEKKQKKDLNENKNSRVFNALMEIPLFSYLYYGKIISKARNKIKILNNLTKEATLFSKNNRESFKNKKFPKMKNLVKSQNELTNYNKKRPFFDFLTKKIRKLRRDGGIKKKSIKDKKKFKTKESNKFNFYNENEIKNNEILFEKNLLTNKQREKEILYINNDEEIYNKKNKILKDKKYKEKHDKEFDKKHDNINKNKNYHDTTNNVNLNYGKLIGVDENFFEDGLDKNVITYFKAKEDNQKEGPSNFLEENDLLKTKGLKNGLNNLEDSNNTINKNNELLVNEKFKEQTENCNECRMFNDANNNENNEENKKFSESKLNQKTLVLDLDETLVHSTFDADKNINHQFIFADQNEKDFFVSIRPGVSKFLEGIKNLGYNIVVYTASTHRYAESIVDLIDSNNAISKLYHRDHCQIKSHRLFKDLNIINDDINNTVVIDNKHVYINNQNLNVFKIPAYEGRKNQIKDNELEIILVHLKEIIKNDDHTTTKHVKIYNERNKS